MFDGLDDIPWERLRHAYGAATDVPDCLRKLTSHDEDTRSDALDLVHSNIWHQGTVYEATAYAVPFLVELVESPNTESRCALTALLGLIANGKGYHQVHNPTKLSKMFERARERTWVNAAREAVRRDLGRLRFLLSENEVGGAASYVVAAFPEEAAASVPCLRAALNRDLDADARAAIGLSLATLGEVEPDAFRAHAVGPRLLALARAAAEGGVPRGDLLEILLDLGTSSFDPRRLDDLGLADP